MIAHILNILSCNIYQFPYICFVGLLRFGLVLSLWVVKAVLSFGDIEYRLTVR